MSRDWKSINERVVGNRLATFDQCKVCGLWTWFWRNFPAEETQYDARCGICAQRGLRPGDVTLPPPAVQQAAVCAWDEGVEGDNGGGM